MMFNWPQSVKHKERKKEGEKNKINNNRATLIYNQ